MFRFFAAASVLLFTLTAAPAQDADAVNASLDALFGAHEPFAEAYAALTEAVAAGDSETVAAWVAYPFSYTIAGSAEVAADADAFVAAYPELVDDEIASAITGTRYGDLFVNADGVMFGNGEMWLSGICRDDACAAWDVRIVAIQKTGE